MPTLILWTLTLTLIVSTRIFAGRWPWAYGLGGLAFGLFIEICFEFCWTYNPVMGPMVWRDVPFLILVGWAGMAALALSLSDAVARRWPLLFKKWQGGLDLVLFAGIGYAAEVLLFGKGAWQYEFSLHESPVIQIAFYLGAGLLVPALARRLDGFVRSPMK